MAQNPGKPEEGSEFNKIDLSTFEEFSFGTQWTPATGPSDGAPSDRRDRRGRDGGAPSRDRRPPRRSGPRDGGEQRPGGDRSGRPGGPGGPRRERRRAPRDDGPRRSYRDQEPYVSRILEVGFYPEDHGFNALVKAMRTSCRTYELFEIARLILGKSERCVAVFRHRPESENDRTKLAISIPDGMPFGTEEEAIQHVISHHLEKFFDVEEIEIDPPKGSFQMVHRCPFTKELLAPPNYHRYASIVEQHHAAKVSRMSLDRYKVSLDTTREPEDIQAWLDKMKKTIRYTSKPEVSEESGVFNSPEDARIYLVRVARAKMAKLADNARVDARVVEKYPDTEAFRTMEGALEQQRRFPLETANALRGRLRRENFHIFKRGSKGITFACSVRRKFRVAGQSFSESVEKLVDYLEANPMTPIGSLPDRYLDIPIHGNQEENHEEIENLPEDKKEAIKKMAMDLRWLVTEGYVAEYSDGRLFAAPAEARPAASKKKAPKPAAPASGAADNGPARVAAAAAAAAVIPEAPTVPTEAAPASPETTAIEVAAPAETAAPVAETTPTAESEGSAETVPHAGTADESKPQSEPEAADSPTQVEEPAPVAEVDTAEPVKSRESGSESAEVVAEEIVPDPEEAVVPETPEAEIEAEVVESAAGPEKESEIVEAAEENTSEPGVDKEADAADKDPTEKKDTP